MGYLEKPTMISNGHMLENKQIPMLCNGGIQSLVHQLVEQLLQICLPKQIEQSVQKFILASTATSSSILHLIKQCLTLFLPKASVLLSIAKQDSTPSFATPTTALTFLY
jgi:hypothetical protein